MRPQSEFFINKETGTVFLLQLVKNGMWGLLRIGNERLFMIGDARFKKMFRKVTAAEYAVISEYYDLAKESNNWIAFRSGEVYMGRDTDSSVNSTSYYDPNQTQTAKAPAQNPGAQKAPSETKVGIIKTPTAFNSFSNLILSDEVLKSVNLGLHKIEMRDFLNNTWNLKSIEEMEGRSALNFYGPPGTGKTASAMAIAEKLKKKLLQVDYSQCVSKWVGETGKNIKLAFEEAKKHDAILFFDEADALLSKRISEDSSVAQSMNSDKNILLQEMDRHDGIVIFTTNFFKNYDDAALRRISHHVEFTLPSSEMREKIIKQHIPKEVPKETIDWKNVAKACDGFSGGDIKNLVINAIIAASMEKKKKLLERHLMEQVEEIKKSKGTHTVTKVISLV